MLRMDMLQFYYYTSVPLITCNMLFYSINSLSTSISSSQTVVKFITEHKDCDSIILKNQITETDLETKLQIIESLIFDIVRQYCLNPEEYNQVKNDLQNPSSFDVSFELENNEFALVELKTKPTMLDRIDQPLKISLIKTTETVQQINSLLEQMREKIDKHQNSYIKTILPLSLQNEMKQLHSKMKILDIRTNMLVDLLKIYSKN